MEAREFGLFDGDTGMSARCRAFGWAATSLGPAERWSPALQAMAGVVLQARQPMILWWGPDLVQLYNDACRPMFGDRERDALGARAREFWRDAWPVVGPEIERMLEGGEATWHEDRLVPLEDSDGRLVDRYWMNGLTPVRDAGTVTGILTTFSETTSQVGMRAAREEALQHSNDLLEEQAAELESRAEELRSVVDALADAHARVEGVLEAMADAYVSVDREFRISAVNAAMERLSGLPRERLLGESIWELFPGTVGNVFEHSVRRTAVEGTPLHFTHDYFDGRADLVTEVDVYPARGRGIAVFWRDVTARVRADAALRESEARFRNMADVAPVMLWVTEAERAVPRQLSSSPTRRRLSLGHGRVCAPTRDGRRIPRLRRLCRRRRRKDAAAGSGTRCADRRRGGARGRRRLRGTRASAFHADAGSEMGLRCGDARVPRRERGGDPALWVRARSFSP